MDLALRAVVTDSAKLEWSEVQKARLRQVLAKHAGHEVDVVFKRHREKRSDRANRYYFGVVIPLIADYCGYERDEMHEALAMKFLRIEDDPITGTPRRQRTPKTDSKEFAEYVDRCRRFATELGVYVPDPGEVAA